jgi:hypothetical protein
MNKKPRDLLLIEQCFFSIKQKIDIHENINKIASVLKRFLDLNISLTIIDNDTNKFFGMNVYPDQTLIDQMIQTIMVQKPHTDIIVELWRGCQNWTIEIDSLLLYDNNLNANPAEIVAVMMHEIGHVIASNTIPQKINKILRFELMNANYAVKKLSTHPKINKLFRLPISDACAVKNFHFSNAEVKADKFTIKMGYGDELDQFINKLIASKGNSLVDRTDAEIDNEIRSVVNWTLINVGELQFRKTKLKQTLQTELIKNPSKYMKKIVIDIKQSFFGSKQDDTYLKMLTEQNTINLCTKIVNESLLTWFDNLGKVKKVSQSDIDMISIEVDKIQNNDDKIYVLDRIYDILEIVNTGLEFISKGQTEKVQQSKYTLQGYKTDLEKMRNKVLNIQIKDKQYGVFIKYPKGYEG